MRLTFTLFFILLLHVTVNAQKITGIWRGYFTSTPLAREGLEEERYKYEVQIEQLANNSISGVTYSYRSTIFYGKAELKGILTLPARSLIIKETKLLELKVAGKSEPCLMTCYLDYTRIGKLEVLEGTFISISVNDKKDCGSGKIYLEKVPDSDFEKEDFLVKKTEIGKKIPSGTTTSGKSVIPPANTQPKRPDNLTTRSVPKPNTNAKTQQPLAKTTVPRTKAGTPPAAKSNSKNTTVTNPAKKDPVVIPPPAVASSEKTIETPMAAQKDETVTQQRLEQPKRSSIPVPKELMERENNLVKTITVRETDIVVELYDNGTIDNDSITVYHNNEKVISTGRLTNLPLVIRIHSTPEDARHELVIVAENLGEIPPNTALMVIKSGRERHEITVASNERRNAKVVIKYVPKE